jgi:hypothetical protein
MSNYNSREVFLKIEKNSHYLRVDDIHPLELLIGLNDSGQKTIRFIGNFQRVQVKGTKTIEINHYQLGDKIIISFSLLDLNYLDLFYLFCNDIIDSSRNIEQQEGYKFIVNRFDKWKGFGNSTRKYLSEIEIKGLLGELVFLRNYIIDKYGISKSINGWTGPEPTKKDFSYDTTWYEVKSVTKDIVSISSIEQLDSDRVGYLILMYFEKLSPVANELTLNKVVDDILSCINMDSDRALFIMKLVQVGFYKEDYYDNYVYKLRDKAFYEVNNKFPKISFFDLPSAVSNVRYDLYINSLEEFRKDSI